ncbi:MAG TPA: PTS sugar transporter subunit IIA [Phycisphaerae bacterium]|jgi:mannitol/fructose-specific phosphotransferase system IIA component (Ntr-type)/nucleotide-binding universal stress UspA family protein|nr:PTS sugar transporter subunit IIA [Phycisphaerae bacterium]HPS52320.1 PTS sugar transporter subunit IIA [Phycisphaerae bacterium]
MTLSTIYCREDEQTLVARAHAYRILLVVTEPPQEQYLRKYADAMARSQSAEIGVFRVHELHSGSWTSCHAKFHTEDRGTTAIPELTSHMKLRQRITEIAESWPFDLLIADWPHADPDMGTFAHLVKDIDTTVVLVRHRQCTVRRVLVPAGGGAHALEGIRIADAMAKAWALEKQVLRIVHPGPDFWARRADLKRRCRHIRNATRLYLDVADVEMPVKVRLGGDVADEIICRSRLGDLIVIGGSSQWLMENHASASIPSRVVSGASGPVLMVLTNRGRPSALTDVFWDRTVAVDLTAEDKKHAIAALVDALVDARQVPLGRRDEVVAAAMGRERCGATYIGHGTAIPHAALQGFRGLVGMLGIFPDGVPFGKTEEENASFLFLLLTPKESYEVYLPILARIARFMNEPDNRRQLAQAKTSADVVALLGHAE